MLREHCLATAKYSLRIIAAISVAMVIKTQFKSSLQSQADGDIFEGREQSSLTTVPREDSEHSGGLIGSRGHLLAGFP